MSDPTTQDLKHKEFIILGLVAENPQGDHAYNIDKKIDERGMRDWTDIGVNISLSTIYRILERIEKDGLLESYEEEVDGRKRVVYMATYEGRHVLKRKIFDVLNNYFGKKDEDFYVAFSMFPVLTKEEQLQAFSNSLAKIKKHKVELEQMLKLNEKFPMNVTGLFKHPIMILKTDIEFLEWVIKNIKEGKQNYGPEAYNK